MRKDVGALSACDEKLQPAGGLGTVGSRELGAQITWAVKAEAVLKL